MYQYSLPHLVHLLSASTAPRVSWVACHKTEKQLPPQKEEAVLGSIIGSSYLRHQNHTNQESKAFRLYW